jgi:pimeloyl-ACP methyl ester carboxylesterase
MPFADVNDQHIYFEDSGGGGPAVIFSHGFLMDHEMFEPQVASLSDFRCVTWDERGFGQTEAHGPFTYWDSADDALALLAHLGIDTAFFVGMSQGGFISLRAALRSPQQVRGLGLIDTDAGVEPEDTKPAYEALHTEWTTNGLSDAIADVVAGIIMSPGYDHSKWIAKWKAIPREALREPFRTLMDRDDLWDQVPQILAPAIVFHGEVDAAFPVDGAKRLARELPHCEELVRIPGAGHASNLSHAEAVNGPLHEFLSRHS